MILSHRIRLDLNNVQTSWCVRATGCARFAWNWGLARWNELYAAGEQPSWQSLNAELNARKTVEFPWMAELPWKITNGALADLGQAFRHFFRRVKEGKQPGYPRFKKRGVCRDGFCLDGREVRFDGRRLRIPKLGWVRLREPLRFPGKIASVRITRRADHWYVSVQVEIDEARWSYPHHCETQAVVGVDLGLVDLAVTSDGLQIAAPRILRQHERQLRRLNKELSRRTKGGRNRAKTKAKLARLHERIANVRHNVTHNLTTFLVERYRWIGIETLSIKGMARTRLAKSVMDAALAEVGRQFDYKAPLAGSNVIRADRFFPSSKTCHVCGQINHELRLGDRQWTCTSCGTVHDRDDNAAQNLKQMAAAHAVTACCPGSAGSPAGTKLLAGQE